VSINRYLDINSMLTKKSLLLLGPRQTGKSWWIKNSLPGIKIYNLLKSEDYTKLAHNPALIRAELRDDDQLLVIDEIQKLPALLDEVQYLIDEHNVNVLLTGSSARKLKARQVNLLGGRARVRNFHPLSWIELQKDFELNKALSRGLIPSIYLSDSPQEDLLSYAGTYLREEVAAEGVAKNVPSFSRFLEVAALCEGQLINYTNVANDSQVAVSTVRTYYQILEDTLLGYQLLPWKQSKKRKAIATAKFYFFDIGVCRHLQGRHILERNSAEYGQAFESYISHEIKTYNDYCHSGMLPLHFWRSTSGFEVDFLIDECTAIEVKSAKVINDSQLKGMRALSEEKTFKHKVVVVPSGQSQKTSDGINIISFDEFLENLWLGTYVN
jgi:uncharacterized protein